MLNVFYSWCIYWGLQGVFAHALSSFGKGGDSLFLLEKQLQQQKQKQNPSIESLTNLAPIVQQFILIFKQFRDSFKNNFDCQSKAICYSSTNLLFLEFDTKQLFLCRIVLLPYSNILTCGFGDFSNDHSKRTPSRRSMILETKNIKHCIGQCTKIFTRKTEIVEH